MELHPPLHLSVVAIEKGDFVSPSTKVTNFTYYWSWPKVKTSWEEFYKSKKKKPRKK